MTEREIDVFRSIARELHDLNRNMSKLIEVQKDNAKPKEAFTCIGVVSDGKVVAEGIGKAVQNSINSF